MVRSAAAATAIAAFAGGVAVPALAAAPVAAPAVPIVWPLSIPVAGGTIVLNEPQVRTWPNYAQMTGIAAIAVTLPGTPAAVYGTASFASLASADVPAGLVTLVNPKITATTWPTANASDAAALDAFLKANLHLEGKPILPLAMVLSSLPRSARPHVALRTNPPVIYVSQSPAVLIVFDGKPSFAPIAGTALTYAVNTNWKIVHDPAAGLYYVHARSGWYSAPGAAGPFAPAVAPASFAAIPATGALSYIQAALKAPKPSGTTVPRVIVSTVPAALINIAGQPQFASIPGTQLRYVSNTSSDLFFSRDTTIWYVLLSGRWFSAPNLNGPWTFASRNLPADFTKIPEESPRGRVLVSVPGTTQAFYAAATAQVPRLTPVDAASAKLSVTYRSGSPVFAPIPGTPLQYAVNSTTDVIMVDATTYFACSDGAWFKAASPTGPWSAANYVPSVIYTIPESSPLYNVTFVHVYNAQGVAMTAPPSTPQPQPQDTYHNTPASELPNGAYYNAQTNGYLGYYAAGWGGYVYGSGYYYPGYYGDQFWISNPPTYGNFDDTTYAREEAASNAPRGGVTMEPPPVPSHGPRSVPGPNTNVFAGDDGVYRYNAGTWEKNTATGVWTAVVLPAASLKHDRKARLDGYAGTVSR